MNSTSSYVFTIGKIKYAFLILILTCSTASFASFGEAVSMPPDTVFLSIRLNQTGFYPDAPKIAIDISGKTGTFYLLNLSGEKVFTGKLEAAVNPDLAGRKVSVADFSLFHKPGKYRLYIPSTGYSYWFNINNSVHAGVAAGTIKAYYYMRASTPLKEQYAGKWNRPEGHPDTIVLIHPSAASETRLAGSVISSPRGWYDAGDYNKYIVNSGISTSTLLSLYEDFPDHMKAVKLNIPESGNGLPDVLNEVLWNLRWMLTMQDPVDGGVYHKLTNASFDGMEMPDKSHEPRYVVQKSTAAALDFAAVTAKASRIFKKYKTQFPGLADSCIDASKRAWTWAIKNPDKVYDQDAMNKKFSPPVSTGTYGDKGLSDEFIWAAAELFVTTRQQEYLKKVDPLSDRSMPIPNWGMVKLLGYYTLINDSGSPGSEAAPIVAELKKRLINLADDLVNGAGENAYQTVMTKSGHFGWGSNSDAANQGIALIQAYRLSHNKIYLKYALANLDYLLGRNATGYSYVTGYGSKTPMHPHHRPTVADGITDPVPGMLVGGPNPGMQDGIKTPSKIPDEAYVDDDRAYSVNEIAINWNAPLAYLANALEALQSELNGIK